MAQNKQNVSIVLIVALFAVVLSTPAYATVVPTELTVELAKGATTIRTIAFSNPRENAVTVTAQAVGVSDVVMILNTPQVVAAHGSATFTLFIQGNKEASGLISLTYDGGFEFVPVNVKLLPENASTPGSGRLSVSYELYVDVGETARLIVRDAETKEAILGADVTIDSPVGMTITADAGYADIPVEENGIWTGSVTAEGYRQFNFVFVAKGEATSAVQITGVTSSPSPLIIGQAGQITAMSSSGVASNVTLVVNGVPYQTNPAVIIPTGAMVSVEVRDSTGKSLYGPTYLTATQQQDTTPPPTPPEKGINYTGVAIVVTAIIIIILLVRRRGVKSPFKRS